MSQTSSTSSDAPTVQQQQPETLAEIRARALKESEERRQERRQKSPSQPIPEQTYTTASQPVPTRAAVAQQQAQQAQAQPQQELTLQQAHDIGLASGLAKGLFVGIAFTIGAYAIYRGASWAFAGAAQQPIAHRPRPLPTVAPQ
jgi:hypothetical protein